MGVCVGGGMHGGGMCGKEDMCGGGACMAEAMFGRGHAWQGHVWQGVCMAGEMVTAADSTHPTGMHSCSSLFL